MTSPSQHSRIDLVSRIVKLGFNEPQAGWNYTVLAVLAVSAIFFIVDVYTDLVIEDEGLGHLLFEGGIFIAVVLALIYQVMRVFVLSSAVSASERTVRLLKKHLNDIISDEFDKWQLTRAERETAILLIKGLSMLEIAELRGVKEKSVRQQATGIYTKAGVSSRYELTAYFIEDLLAPTMN